VDSKAVRDQLNVAQKLKQTNASAHLVQFRRPWRQPGRNRKTMGEKIVKDMSFKSEVKD